MSGRLPSRRFRDVQLLIGASLVMLVAVSVAVLEGTLSLARALDEEVVRRAALAAEWQSGRSSSMAASIESDVLGGATFLHGRLSDSWGEWGPENLPWWPWSSREEWERAGRVVAGPVRLSGRYVAVAHRVPGNGRVVRTVVAAPAAEQAWRWRWLGGSLALVVAGGGGLLAWLLIVRALAPYRELLAEAARVAGRPGVEAEDRYLVQTFRTTVRLLEESEAALRQRAEDLSVLAAGLAHEIRNALATITGYLRLLPAASEEKRHEYVTVANDEATNLSQLLERFLTLAQPHTLRRSAIRLDEITGEALRRVRVNSPRTRFEVEAPAVEVEADPMALGVVVENLLRNAAEASHDRPAAVEVRIEEDEANARVVVEDRGPGVSREMEDRLFMPFSSTKPSGGLGLALARRLARLHGGDVRYEMRAGGGARFVLELPLRRES